MNILINHCWCSDSIWGGYYDCLCIVTLDRVPDGKTYYDPPCPDWTLVEEYPHISGHEFNHRDKTLRPRADVLNWLKANVKDRKLTKYERDQGDHAKGWAIGTDEYNSADTISFSFFFERQMDGMRFIKRWSHHKNPVSYLQYFIDVRKKLDPKTGKLKRVAR